MRGRLARWALPAALLAAVPAPAWAGGLLEADPSAARRAARGWIDSSDADVKAAGFDVELRAAGFERLAALPERRGKEALLETLGGTGGTLADPRTQLAALRALRPFAGDPDVAAAVTTLLERRGIYAEESPLHALVAGTAARLARFGAERDVEARLLALHGTAAPPVRRALEDAFAERPPSAAMYGAPNAAGGFALAPLPTPTLLALARTGDLRAVEALYARLLGKKALGATKPKESKDSKEPKRPKEKVEDEKKTGGDVELHDAVPALLDALADAEDARALPLAKSQLTSDDGAIVAAAVRVLVRLGARERFSAVEQIVTSTNFGRLGLELAPAAPSPKTIAAVIARRDAPADPAERELARRALAQLDDAKAAETLARHALDPRDPVSRADVPGLDDALALGRSPSPAAAAAIEGLSGKSEPIAFIAFLAQALERGAAAQPFKRLLERAEQGTPAARARAAFARAVLAGEPPPVPAVRPVGNARARAERARTTFPDAPAAAEAWAEKAERGELAAVIDAFAGAVRFQKVHLARGLARSPQAAATGALAKLALAEVDPVARRALVRALSARRERSPNRRVALETFAATDPDREVRALASAALADAPLPTIAPARRRLIVLRLDAAGPLPKAAPRIALWVDGRGEATPVAFDDDGFAFALSTDDGEGTLLVPPATEPKEPK